MVRATTPTHYFTLPSGYEDNISELLVTYAQNLEIVLEKRKNDATFDGSIFYFTLTQEETNLFDANYSVELQIRIKTNDGQSVASPIYKMTVERVLNDEVL
jgi:hypothetical protein